MSTRAAPAAAFLCALCACCASAQAQFVQDIGGGTGDTTTGLATIPVTALVQAGDTIVIGIAAHNGATANSITDSASNTYTYVQSFGFSPSSMTTEVYAAYAVAPLSAGQTIVVHLPVNGLGQELDAAAVEFAGLDTANPVDATVTNNARSTTAMSAGTLATSNASDLLFVAFGQTSAFANTTFTPGAGYTASARFGGTQKTVDTEFRYVDAAGSYATDATCTPSADNIGVAVAFRSTVVVSSGSASSSSASASASASSSSSSASSGSGATAGTSSSSSASATGSTASASAGASASASASSTSSSSGSGSGSTSSASSSGGGSAGAGGSGHAPPGPYLPEIGCGCSSGSTDLFASLLILGVALLRRPRRR